MTQLLALLVALLLPLVGLLAAPAPAAADTPAKTAAPATANSPSPQRYLCAGEPLLAEVHIGAVDAPGIPNSASGTVPGAFIVLQWRGVSLQLPRTNNAGTPSYSDGRWWWQASDADHPEFAQRRGDWEHYSCERAA